MFILKVFANKSVEEYAYSLFFAFVLSIIYIYIIVYFTGWGAYRNTLICLKQYDLLIFIIRKFYLTFKKWPYPYQ